MLKAKAIFDCTADDDAELTFVEGDIIIDVVQSAEEGWYDGRLERTNKRGLFPHNYVKIFEDTSKPTPPPRPSQTSKPSDAIPAPTTIRPSTSSTSSSSQWSTISASVPKDETTPFAKPKTWAGFGDNFDSDQPVKSSATKDIQDAFGAARPGKLPTAALATFTAAQNHSSSPTPALLTRLKPETKPKSATATTAVAAKQGSADDDAEVDMPFMSVKAMRASLEGAGNKPLTRSATGKSVLDEDEPPVLLRPSSIKQQQQQQATKKDIPVLPAPKPLVVKKSQPEPTPVVAEDDPEPQTLRPSTIRRQQLLGGKNDGSTSTTPMPTAIAPKPRLPDRPSGTPPLQPKPDGQRTRLVSQSQTDAPVGGTVLPPLLPRKPGLSATVAEKEPPLLPRRPAAGQNGAGVGGEEAGDGGEPPKLPMRPKAAPPSSSVTPAASNFTSSALAPKLPGRPALPPRRDSSGAATGVPPPAPPRPKKHNPFEENESSRFGIPPDARQRYEIVFDANHSDNFMDGTTVRKIWAKSRLDPKTLAKIWELADMDEDGLLNQHEFCVGMHLIDDRLRGFPVPEVLPSGLRAA